jgi:hypothetical protein
MDFVLLLEKGTDWSQFCKAKFAAHHASRLAGTFLQAVKADLQNREAIL